MGTAALTGLIWALVFAGLSGLLSIIRESDASQRKGAFAWNFVVGTVVLFSVDYGIFYGAMPATRFSGILTTVLWNILVVAVVATVVDYRYKEVGAASAVAILMFFVGCITWVIGHNGPHDAKAATNIVKITEEKTGTPPASSTKNMVVVSPDIATAEASSVMNAGRNYSTYLELGKPTLQYVQEHMWYVFALHFDGSGNKHKLHNVEPGYIMVNAEDPTISSANVIERYDGAYTMKICEDCGQDSEPVRWAYNHGYTGTLEDPTPEIDEDGNPYWTLTENTPHVGWTFNAPSSLLVINAHTGQITQYALNKVPDWVDRVYSQDMAKNLVSWYGDYGLNGSAGWKGVSASNANRFQVSGDPVLVYTGDSHPDWRMLLTSYNSDSSVAKVVIMDSQTGAMQVYPQAASMKTEDKVIEAFKAASGQGTAGMKTGLNVTDPTLHMLYGHLTWMVTFDSGGSSPTFNGIGFVDAYNTSSNQAVYGNGKEVALQNYLLQLATAPTSNGNAPQQGATTSTVTGVIQNVSWDLSGGQKLWYITLVGDPTHAYVGNTTAIGPAVVLAAPGDNVTIKYINTGASTSLVNMLTFIDSKVPLQKAGS